ncbi:MAG: AIR synthase-related protein [Candidatus Altiarchaeota archaeon]|nr:AIR synthase-related protein [Candidatus Altiarchaeota archaeon]
MKYDIERCIEHMLETNPIRKVFWHMDERVENLSYGIKQGDDAVVVGKLVVNMEGPYPLKIGRKTGLIHTCSDIVVMGGIPLFALNSMQVDSIKEAAEVSEDIKKQSLGLNVPMVGGNTQMENELLPCVSFTVVGEIIDKPIPDAGAKTGDKILMLGEIVEGTIGERVYRAKTKFNTFMEILEKKVRVNASKDCSRGGWFGNLSEIMVKSRKGIQITGIPYPEVSRYMGTYLISVPKKDVQQVVEIAAKNKCPVVDVGTVTKEIEMKIGSDVVVDEEKMNKLIRSMPFKASGGREE